MNFIEIISEKYATLSRSEKKVAQVIISEPQKAIHTSIAALAKQAGVSEPSVHRFCQKVNTKGFPDFKLRLAQSLGKVRLKSMKMTQLKATLKRFLMLPFRP